MDSTSTQEIELDAIALFVASLHHNGIRFIDPYLGPVEPIKLYKEYTQNMEKWRYDNSIRHTAKGLQSWTK